MAVLEKRITGDMPRLALCLDMFKAARRRDDWRGESRVRDKGGDVLAFWTTTSYVKDGESLLLQGQSSSIDSSETSTIICGLHMLVSYWTCHKACELRKRDVASVV